MAMGHSTIIFPAQDLSLTCKFMRYLLRFALNYRNFLFDKTWSYSIQSKQIWSDLIWYEPNIQVGLKSETTTWQNSSSISKIDCA